MTSEKPNFAVPIAATIGAAVGAGAMFVANQFIRFNPYQKGITISSAGYTKYVPDDKFQTFFELSVSRGQQNDYAILEYAINRDYRNLEHLRNNEMIFPLVQLALDHTVEALNYCRKIDNPSVLARVIEYAKEKYGEEVYNYIERPQEEPTVEPEETTASAD
jgi:hypothetical protein